MKVKDRRALWSRFSITGKLLLSFLVVFVASFAIIGGITIHNINEVGHFARENSIALGERAASDSAIAIENLGQATIEQKALDVSKQIEIYLAEHPDIMAEEIGADSTLAEIAVQPVGETSCTCMYGKETGIMRFHTNPELIDFDMHNWKGKLPTWWAIFEPSLDGSVSNGYYYWEYPDGSIRKKFMYMVPVGETRYMIAATTHADEFLRPSQFIQSEITSAALATGQYIDRQRESTQAVLIATILGMLAIIGGLALWLSRTITKPILALDEIQELAEQFNAMAGALRESYTDLEQKVEERTRGERRRAEQLRAINEVGRRISSILSLDELLPYVVSSLQKTFKYYNVNIFLLDLSSEDLILKAGAGGYKRVVPIGSSVKATEGIVGWVAQTGEPLLANDISQEPKYYFVEELADTRSELAVPIKVGGEILGVLDIESAELNAFDEMDLFTAQILADQVAIAIENARLYKETRDMAVLEERNRMAREIHDTLAQGFTGIVLQLEAAEQALGEDDNKAQEHLDRTRSLARESLTEARRSVWALRPQPLEQLPLAEAVVQEIDKFSQGSGIKTNFDISGERCPLPPDTESALLRICAEALTNVGKHARASKVDVNLAFEGKVVRLSIQDNGVSFDPDAPTEGTFGLIGMRERARLLGGMLVVQSERGKGTLVEATMPAG